MLPLTLMRPGRAEDAEGFQVERESVGSQPCLSHLSSSHLHPWIALSFTLWTGRFRPANTQVPHLRDYAGMAMGSGLELQMLHWL